MPEYSFETIKFLEKEDSIRAIFQKFFYFDIPKEDVKRIGKIEVKDGVLSIYAPEKRSNHKFNMLLENGFKNLKHLFTKHPAVYIHQNSGVPLVGHGAFGIIDRNTNIIEVKPITGCNIKCVFCSVPDCKRDRDFIVEEEYMIQDLKEIIAYKESDDIEVHIGVQGEPLLYGDLVKFVKDSAAIPEVKRITMNTNASILTEKMADDLIEAGMTRINVSMNSLDPKKAKLIADAHYNIDHVKHITKYIAEKYPGKVHIAPVVMFGINDDDMGDIVEFAKSININCWIQNFLEYKGGNKPAKQKDWEFFKEFLRGLEKKHDVKLLADFKVDFKLSETKPLPKYFKKGDTVEAEIVCVGRLDNEWIAAHEDRTISIINNKPLTIGQRVRVHITSFKHNIASGSVVN